MCSSDLKRRFAGAVESDDADVLAVVDRQIGVVEQRAAVKDMRQSFDGQYAHVSLRYARNREIIVSGSGRNVKRLGTGGAILGIVKRACV